MIRCTHHMVKTKETMTHEFVFPCSQLKISDRYLGAGEPGKGRMGREEGVGEGRAGGGTFRGCRVGPPEDAASSASCREGRVAGATVANSV